MDHGPLEEVPLLDLGTDLLRLVEVVVHAVLLALAGLAARRGHVDDGVVERLHEPLDHRVLPRPRRRRDDHEQPATVHALAAQGRAPPIASRSGVRTAGPPRAARKAARAGARGAADVPPPACGPRP